ncbi:hypothetical protein [Persephonella sp.]
MYVAIIGNSYFGCKLASQLAEFDRSNIYKFYNTSGKLSDKILFTRDIYKIDIVYSIGASVKGGGALKLALLTNKRIVQHFIGSDVLQAQESVRLNSINKTLIRKSKFLCEVDWIKKELADINIDAEVKPIMVYEKKFLPKDFNDFSVLTYIGKGKEDFYGIKDFIKLALDFPHIKFKIAGIESYKNLPTNIKCLGWIDMITELQNSTVFIRNTKHDGLAFSVIEALGLGRIVFRNYRFPFVEYFSTYEELKNLLEKTYTKYKQKKLNINFDAIDFVRINFNKNKILSDIIEVLTKVYYGEK